MPRLTPVLADFMVQGALPVVARVPLEWVRETPPPS